MRMFEVLAEGRSSPISKVQAYELLETKFSDARSATPIYRGLNAVKEYLLASPDGFNARPAANTSNHVNLLVDNFSSWKEFPKRNRSFICTTNSKYAENYGAVYRVYPANGAKIGVCDADDFWNAFPRLREYEYMNVASFAAFLEDNAAKNGDNFPELVKGMNEFGERLRAGPPENPSQTMQDKYNFHMYLRYSRRFDDFIKSRQPFSEFVEWLLNPKANRFQLHTPSSFHNMPQDAEVWTEGPILMVRYFPEEEYDEPLDD